MRHRTWKEVTHPLGWHRGFKDYFDGKPFDKYESADWMEGWFFAQAHDAVAKPNGD